MGIRKYPEVKGYWVYSIKIVSINRYYIGISKRQCYERWRKKEYKGTAIEPYLEEWDSMEKTILVDNLSKEEALKYEDNIIQALSMNNLCINKKRSGLITDDKNAYEKELLKNNPEYHERRKQYQKQYRRQYRLKKKLEQYTSLQQ